MTADTNIFYFAAHIFGANIDRTGTTGFDSLLDQPLLSECNTLLRTAQAVQHPAAEPVAGSSPL